MAVPRAPRLIVPDVLRGVAIVAMVLAHAAPMLPGIPHVLKSVTGNISDLASPLFALVMGMSAQLVWNAGGRVGAVLLQQAIRGVVLIALGVWMASWGSWVVIVLAFLGMLLIVGVPLLLLPTRWLAVAAGLAALVSAPVNALAREHVVPLVTSGPVIRHLAEWTVLGHSYRLTNLLPFFLLGALLLRHGLRRDRTMWGMLAIAPVAYLVRPVAERMLHVDFISGSYPDTLHDIGLVFAAYAVIVLLATPTRPQPVVDAVFVPLKAWGRVALSLYLLHVGIIALWLGGQGARPAENAWGGWLLVVVVPLAVGWLWWRFVGNGPVEWLLGLVSLRPKPLRVRSAGVASVGDDPTRPHTQQEPVHMRSRSSPKCAVETRPSDKLPSWSTGGE